MGRSGRDTILVLVAMVAVWAAPVAGGWRFIVVGDSQGVYNGVNGPVLSELVGEILRQDVELVVFAGDLVAGPSRADESFEGQLWEWVRIMGPVYNAGIDVYACRGNHEVRDMWDLAPEAYPDPTDNYALRWLAVFGSRNYPDLMLPDNGPPNERHMTYSVGHKNALIVGLDEYGGMRHQRVHYVNQGWLDEELKRNTRPHVFVFGHEPAFRSFHWDCLDAHPERRDAFWRSLKRADGRVYFCGHDHYYDHAVVDDGDGDPANDIHQIIAGTGGGTFYTWTPPYDGNNTDFTVRQRYHARQHGYMLIEVDDLDVTVTWMERHQADLLWPGFYGPRDVWRYSVAPGPRLLQPNGAERVVSSRVFPIRWKTMDGTEITRVTIEYSVDRGKRWMLIDEVDNHGGYEWLAPAVNSSNCLVRVSDAHDPAKQDTSDSTFSIFKCHAKLRADLNGDCRVDFADLAILMEEWLACGDPLDPACGGKD
jgi:hypothetical protein